MPRGPGRMRQGSSGAGVVLAAIVGTPADRRAPREGGDVWNGTNNDLRRPPWRGAKAVWGSRHPPHRSFFLPSHIPTDQGAVGRTARLALGWISQSRKTHFVWVSLKMGSRARNHHFGRASPSRRGGPATARPDAAGNNQYYQYCCQPPGRRSVCSLLIYPPTRAQWAARPGGLWGELPDPAKPILYVFC